jgi:DNA-binding transcriptional regulator LsrR (DeoR family)
MPAKRELSMRQLRHLLRLHHGGVSAREIGRRLGVARSTVQDNLKRAAAAGLAWPLADNVTDDALELRLFGRAGVETVTVTVHLFGAVRAGAESPESRALTQPSSNASPPPLS